MMPRITCALLCGLVYCLNLSYPPELRCSFEVQQNTAIKAIFCQLYICAKCWMKCKSHQRVLFCVLNWALWCGQHDSHPAAWGSKPAWAFLRPATLAINTTLNETRLILHFFKFFNIIIFNNIFLFILFYCIIHLNTMIKTEELYIVEQTEFRYLQLNLWVMTTVVKNVVHDV